MNIEKEIITLIETECTDDNECSIDFNSLPLSKWDEAYIFSNVSKEYIQSKIKVPYVLYKDIGVKIIFVHNGKIISYHELFPVLDTKNTKSKVVFSFDMFDKQDGKKVGYYHLTPSNAKVNVIKQEYSNDGVSKIITYRISPDNTYQIGD